MRAHAAVEDRSSSACVPPPRLYRGVDGGYMTRPDVRPGSSGPSRNLRIAVMEQLPFWIVLRSVASFHTQYTRRENGFGWHPHPHPLLVEMGIILHLT
jgi:hypothetical protein